MTAGPEATLPMTAPAASAHDAAVRLHLQGDLAGAREAYLALLRSHPGHATALNNLGFLEMQAGDAAAARGRFMEALERDPAAPTPHANLGLLHAGLGEWDAARGHLERAAAIAPDDAATWSSLGQVLSAQGDAAGAEACWGRSAALQPTARRLAQLAAGRMAVGDVEGALAAAEAAVGLDPADPGAWTQAGIALMARRDLGSAADAFRRAVAITPAAHGARHHLALLHLAGGDVAAARGAWSHLLEAAPGHPCRLDLAVLELTQGRPEAARGLLEAAPPGPRRDHYLAVARHRLGDPDALAELQAQAAGADGSAERSRSYLASLARQGAGA